jgi:membrane-associated phospholipid phosphatase
LVLLLEAVMSGLCFLLLLKWCVPGASPLQIVWDFAREHAVSRQSLFYLLTLLGIMFLDLAEVRYDGIITHHLGWDFTNFFLRIEGPATALFQAVKIPWLTYAMSAVYLYIFPALGFVAVIATYHGGERDLARKLFWGTIFNYILILPFYILVPVSERWAASDGQVSFLMNEVSPFLIEGLRPLSGLNNCFPSFHCSLALTFALLLSQSANGRLRGTMVVMTALVVASTLYLGFHWVLDILGGVVFAAGCTLLATWAVDNLKLELVLQRAR